MTAAGGWLRQAAAAREAATDPNAGALDAVAAAFQLLSTDWEPIGTGPYRFVSESAAGVRVEAWPGYHGGPAATRYIDFVPANADEASVLAGTVDIQQGVGNGLGADFRATADSHGLRVGNPPQSGFYSLQLNVRPGRLFADRALRQALQLCIDLPRDVDAATGGVGVPVYGPVLPGSWADEPDLPKPARDVAAAKTLIEGAGWQPGADGVYAKGGAPLAATILVRADSAYRGTMADLIALQARDCGMDLQVRPMTWDETTTMFGGYPHLIPGTDEPFDVYLGGWIAGADPDDGLSIFASSNATDAEHPDNANFGGFSDAAYDRAPRGREVHLRPGRAGAALPAGAAGARRAGARDLPVRQRELRRRAHGGRDLRRAARPGRAELDLAAGTDGRRWIRAPDASEEGSDGRIVIVEWHGRTPGGPDAPSADWALPPSWWPHLASGCGAQPTPTLRRPVDQHRPTPAPTASPAPAYADTLRIGFVPWGPRASRRGRPRTSGRPRAGSSLSQVLTVGTLVHGCPLSLDARYDAVPDLADGPCEPQGDGDGHPLPARRDDVPRRDAVDGRRRGLHATGSSCGTCSSSGRACGQADGGAHRRPTRTVDFVLTPVDPTFLTTVLPDRPDPPAPRRRGFVRRLRRRDAGPRGSRTHAVRRHDRRRGRSRSAGAAPPASRRSQPCCRGSA